jgi:hypothetical protein
MIRNAMAASSTLRFGSAPSINVRSTATTTQALPLPMIGREGTQSEARTFGHRIGTSSSNSRTRGVVGTLLILVTIVGSGIMFLNLHGSLLAAGNPHEAGLQEESARQLNEWHLRQLSIVHDEIHALAQQKQLSLAKTKPPLDVSFFSRPPRKPTQPTQFQHEAKKSDPNQSPYQCSLYQPNEKETTTGTSNTVTHQWALARMVVFQKNGGKQLVTWVTHYLHVLPPDALVLIDHASTDPWTLSLLHQYAMLGMHVWHCSGSYQYGREVMWSSIGRIYRYDSAFIFPLDVDELVTIHDMPDDSIAGTTRPRKLIWDTHSIYHALDSLATSGKPFKMEQVDVIPGDCHLPLDESPDVNPGKTTLPPKWLFPSPVCAVTHAMLSTQPIPVGCMHKNFCRGPDFVQTDLGNHYLVTNWTIATVPELKFSGYNIVQKCDEDGVYTWYEPSPLVLLHLQRLEFADWFLHYLRGASMHGYTYFKASTPTSDCPSLARHYCEQWIEFERYEFNVDALRPVYQARFCPHAADTGLSPIANVFDHACGR